MQDGKEMCGARIQIRQRPVRADIQRLIIQCRIPPKSNTVPLCREAPPRYSTFLTVFFFLCSHLNT